MTGDSIRKSRIKLGLTQKELACLANVSQAHIAKIERGTVDPRLSTVNKILKVLKPGQEGRCRDVMTAGVIFTRIGDTVLKASEIMVRNAVSQLPVLDGNRVIGTVTEQGIVRNLKSDLAVERVTKVLEPPMPEVQEDTSIETVREILERSVGVLVKRKKEIVGILTRSDLLRTIG